MKKSILLVVFIAVALIAGNIFGQSANKKYGMLLPVSDGKNEGILLPLTDKEAKALLNKTAGLYKFNNVTQIIDTLLSTPKDAGTTVGPYFGGDPGDTFAVYFSPGAGCKILQVGFNAGYWQNDPELTGVLWSGINLSLNFAYYDGTPEPGQSGKILLGEMANGVWTPTEWYAANYPHSPVGAPFWGSFPASITPEPSDAEEIIEMAWLGVEADCEGKDFAVIFVPFGATGSQGGFDDTQNWAEMTHDQFIWKWYISDNKWYVRAEGIGFYVWCLVEFYENTPPFISGMNQIVGTYDLTKDFVVQATLTDIDASDIAKGGIAEAHVVWSTESGKLDSSAITNVSGDTWEGKITGLTQEDYQVTYWVSAKDKGNPALYKKSSALSFVVGPKNPNSDLLLVLQAPHNSQFYRDALNNLGFVYEEWNANTNGGIDASVTGFGWGTIVVAGWGANTVPTRSYAGNPYAAFLNGGGNMFLGDMDLFYTNGEAADTTFTAGDFVYDFLGVAGCLNDPGAHLDSVIYGVAGDPISNDWADTPMNLDWYRYAAYTDYNWTDYITAGNATKIFTAESGNDVGVRYEGSNFKTVFLSFMPDALGEETASPDFDKLIQNVLTWFETKQAVSVETGDNTPIVNTYSLKQNYPNPFNPVTTIEYTIPEAGQVNIAIYNVLGKKVAELVNKHQKAGKYDIIWDAKDAANGVYFYKMKAGDYTKTMKMLLLR